MPRPPRIGAARINLLCLLALAPARWCTPFLLQRRFAPTATIVPVDGVEACDAISCTATLRGLAPVRQPRRPAPAHPWARRFAGFVAPVAFSCSSLTSPRIFAVAHDAALLGCLSDICPFPALPARAAQLPLRLRGLGLRSAIASAPAACWAY